MMTAKYFDLTSFQSLFLPKWVFFQITFYLSDQALKKLVTIMEVTLAQKQANTRLESCSYPG